MTLNIYDAWDNGDRPEIRKQLAQRAQRQWQPLSEDTLEELLGLHCSTSGNMSEADAREFAKDLESRIKGQNT
jgi:hypothetical protein